MEFEHPHFRHVRPIVLEAIALRILFPQRQYRSPSNVQRKRGEVVLLLDPLGPGRCFAGPPVEPLPWRQVELDVATFGEDGGNEQAVADKELSVEEPRRRVVWELERRGPQAERPAHAPALLRLRHQVRHQAALEPDKFAQHGGAALLGVCRGFGVVGLVDEPRHAVRVRAVQARVAAQEAEGHPALVDPRRRVPLEAANVAGPKGEAGQPDGEAPADRLAHGGGCGFAVAAPALRGGGEMLLQRRK